MKKGKVVSNNCSIAIGVIGSIILGTAFNYASLECVSEKALSDSITRYEKTVSVKYDSVYGPKTIDNKVVNEQGSVNKEVGVTKAISVSQVKEKEEQKSEVVSALVNIGNNKVVVEVEKPKVVANKTESTNKTTVNKTTTNKTTATKTTVNKTTTNKTTATKTTVNKTTTNKTIANKTTVNKTTTNKTTANKTTANKTTANKTTTKKVTTKQANTVSSSELMYLACIVFAESGAESYQGKLAVANVVLNRVNSKSFPNTIYGVISQRGQFGPYSNGALNKAIQKYKSGYFTTGKTSGIYKNYTQSLAAAKAALKGTNNIGKRLYFNTVGPAKAYRIGNHKFW